MRTKGFDNVRLGLFVLAGLLFLILSLYLIGKNRNLFGSTFEIHARFNNVNGLVPGNNVRFSGIDVGTVRSIELKDDSSIFVTMVIDKKVKQFIRKNALASIGTDGLMGNKLININSREGEAEPVEEGDLLLSRKPVETDEMLRTLNTTNENIVVITSNLKEITRKLNNSNSLWNLLADTVVAVDIKNAVAAIRRAGNNTEKFTREADDLIQRLKQGDGLAGTLITDSLLVQNLRSSLGDLQLASQNAVKVTSELSDMVNKIEEGEGTTGRLLSDTTWSAKLYETLVNIEEGTARFNENMEAMRHNFLFRGYFKKQEKEMKKQASAKKDSVK
ncbi:MAG TPA: MlaD family protein [Cyclobacteriaceae bacterium]|nr:MlaD family protein [Cyclobacteriaceae bacterium]